MPPGSQLVVSARGEPGLAVGRLRAHRKLAELRTADLAMDAAEAAALLERVDLKLSDHEVDTLVRRTEGCPAVSRDSARRLVNLLGEGSVVFIWYPDQTLLSTSEYVERGVSSLRLPGLN